MVRIISAPNPHPHPFLRIWYELLEIRRIWMRMWIVDKRISDENGRGYDINNIRRIWIIRLFLRIIRRPQIGLSDKISLLCRAIIYIAHFTVLLLLIINSAHKLMSCMNMRATLDVI